MMMMVVSWYVVVSKGVNEPQSDTQQPYNMQN